MFPNLSEIWSKYSKEITLILVTAISTFFFTKLLPTIFEYLKKFAVYFFALITGRHKEYKFEHQYLDWLINEHKYITVIPSQVLNPERLPRQPELEDVFIQLQLKNPSNDGTLELPIANIVEKGSKTVILGDPGSGKTTLLKYICLNYAKLARTPLIYYKSRKSFRERITAKTSVIPVFIYLNRLSQGSSNILEEIENSLPESLKLIYPKNYFQKLLEKGKAVILLDGLDEVSSAVARNQIAQRLSSLSNASHVHNTWIVSSRIVGYKGQLQGNFATAVVQPFTILQVQKFVRTWYQKKCENTGFPASELEYQQGVHARRADHLINTLKSNPGLASLATNPMLVSLIALLHSVQIELPENRALLYRDCVELLADRWDLFRGVNYEVQAKVSTQHKISILMSIAWRMHSQKLKEIKRSEVEALISQKLSEIVKAADAISAEQILSNLEERSGLLINRGTVESGEKVMAFSHLSFQEYLTATSLISKPESEAKTILSNYLDDPWWREAILLYVAQIDNAFKFIQEIYVTTFREKIIEGLLLTASCLAEVQTDKTSELYKKAFDDIVFLYSGGSIERTRIEAIKQDKYNALLRHMIRFVQNLSSIQLEALKTLLRIKRNVTVNESDMERLIQSFESLEETSAFDLTIIESLCKHTGFLPFSRRIPFVFKYSGSTPINVDWLNIESISFHKFIEIALNEKNLSNIIQTISLIVPRLNLRLDDFVVKHDLDWREETLRMLILNHKTAHDIKNNVFRFINSSDSPILFEIQLNEIKDYFSKLSQKEYTKAALTFHNIRATTNITNEAEIFGLITQRYYNSDGLLDRCFCIMLLCHLDYTERELLNILIDFVSNNKSFSRNSNTENMLGTLAHRALEKLSRSNLEDDKLIPLLLDYDSGGNPAIADFVLSKIWQIPQINGDSVKYCLEMLDSQAISKIWLSLFILAVSRDDETIDKILPFLSYKDQSLHGVTVSDLAARSILKIMAVENSHA